MKTIKHSDDKFNLIFNDGSTMVKTRWEMAVAFTDNITEHNDGTIVYNGVTFGFVATPIKQEGLLNE